MPRSDTTLADLVDAELLRPDDTLTGRYRGETLACSVTADGRLLDAAGETASVSPSGAVRLALTKTFDDSPKLIPGGSGWAFWHATNGDSLDTLRARLAEAARAETPALRLGRTASGTVHLVSDSPKEDHVRTRCNGRDVAADRIEEYAHGAPTCKRCHELHQREETASARDASVV